MPQVQNEGQSWENGETDLTWMIHEFSLKTRPREKLISRIQGTR